MASNGSETQTWGEWFYSCLPAWCLSASSGSAHPDSETRTDATPLLADASLPKQYATMATTATTGTKPSRQLTTPYRALALTSTTLYAAAVLPTWVLGIVLSNFFFDADKPIASDEHNTGTVIGFCFLLLAAAALFLSVFPSTLKLKESSLTQHGCGRRVIVDAIKELPREAGAAGGSEAKSEKAVPDGDEDQIAEDTAQAKAASAAPPSGFWHRTWYEGIPAAGVCVKGYAAALAPILEVLRLTRTEVSSLSLGLKITLGGLALPLAIAFVIGNIGVFFQHAKANKKYIPSERMLRFLTQLCKYVDYTNLIGNGLGTLTYCINAANAAQIIADEAVPGPAYYTTLGVTLAWGISSTFPVVNKGWTGHLEALVDELKERYDKAHPQTTAATTAVAIAVTEHGGGETTGRDSKTEDARFLGHYFDWQASWAKRPWVNWLQAAHKSGISTVATMASLMKLFKLSPGEATGISAALILAPNLWRNFAVGNGGKKTAETRDTTTPPPTAENNPIGGPAGGSGGKDPATTRRTTISPGFPPNSIAIGPDGAATHRGGAIEQKPEPGPDGNAV